MKRFRNYLIGWILAAVFALLRLTCRQRKINDPRAELRAAGVPYVVALLHAHQVAAILSNDERRGRISVMVSQSADGDLIVPLLRLAGVRVARGSSRRGSTDKGGLTALSELGRLLQRRVAVLLTVDGPRGPRNCVHRGVAALSRQVKGAVVLPMLVLPSRRWILARTWDRMQIPRPFARITNYFAAPIHIDPDESNRDLRNRIAAALDALEREHDPDEAQHAGVAVADSRPRS